MKLSEAIRQFLEYCEIEKNQSKKTLTNYQHYLGRFLEFSDDMDIEKISLSLVKKYRLFLNRFEFRPHEFLTVKTQNYHVIALRAFLKYCTKQDWKTLEPVRI